MRLEGKVAIVTGAGRGLGRAFALALAREGASVTVAEVDPVTGPAVAAEIVAMGGRAIATHTDVSMAADTEAMVARTVEAFGTVDILVNNAGITTDGPTSWEEIDPDRWNRSIGVNLSSVYLCSRAVWPIMKAKRAGKIINISSATIWYGTVGWLPYISSKAGIVGFTRALAREVGDYGVCVNAITPGATRTEGAIGEVTDRERVVIPGRSLKRAEEPEDLVGAVIFFASSDSDFITGQTLNVDGGFAAH